MKNIVLFGPPGSGKGTQANNIITKYQLIHLSTGDMLRAEIAEQTKLGMEAKSLMDKGDLVPDAVVIGMIENKLDANPKAAGFVFDGFPRTVNQAVALDKLLEKRNAPIQKVLSLKVSEDELTKRILERGKTSNRPDDQNPEIVKNRVVEYRTKTEPLAEYYAKQGKLVEIQGEGTVDHISDLLNYEIDNIADKNSGVIHEVSSFINNTVEKIFHKKDNDPAWPESKEDNDEPVAPVSPSTLAPRAGDKGPAKPVAKTEGERVPFPLSKKAAPKKAAKKAPAKKAVNAAPKKAVAAKKAVAPKKAAAPKKASKKVAAPKKAVAHKKAVKKAPVKKVAAKKIAPKKVLAKKAAAKKAAAKKAAPKKVVAAKKVAPKKIVKKAIAKKAAKKAVVKKAAPKKVLAKKAAKKAAPKKVVAKKVVKKAAPKKVVVKKVAPKKAIKKAAAKKKR